MVAISCKLVSVERDAVVSAFETVTDSTFIVSALVEPLLLSTEFLHPTINKIKKFLRI